MRVTRSTAATVAYRVALLDVVPTDLRAAIGRLAIELRRYFPVVIEAWGVIV